MNEDLYLVVYTVYWNTTEESYKKHGNPTIIRKDDLKEFSKIESEVDGESVYSVQTYGRFSCVSKHLDSIYDEMTSNRPRKRPRPRPM